MKSRTETEEIPCLVNGKIQVKTKCQDSGRKMLNKPESQEEERQPPSGSAPPAKTLTRPCTTTLLIQKLQLMDVN